MIPDPRLLPALYTAAQCRELDRLAIEEQGIAGFDLMLRAGRAAFRELLDRWPECRRVVVCCGKGNNAGDGYVVAGLARESGLAVTLWQLGSAADLGGDAARARDWAAARGVEPRPGPPSAVDGDVVVDALLGTGLRGELAGPFAACAVAINSSGLPVLAIDIPTGVNADTGSAAANAVWAAVTVTFIGRKLGLFTGPGIAHAGTVVFDDLSVPGAVYRALPGCPWLRYPALPSGYRLAARDANVYKQALGHLLVIGGERSMGGAPLMAAEAALRTGAGMVTVLTRAEHRPAILARRPELMVVDADDAAGRRRVLDKATALVVGPGLGQTPWSASLLHEALALGLPTVLDADGLNLFADARPAAPAPLVVTPHAGEAARLLGLSSASIQQDRPGAALALARLAGGAAVLKGAGTLIAAVAGADAELLGVCGHGNPGMATAGMGDVLSGVIGGFLAQGMGVAAAAVAGTCLHGLAADRAALALGRRSLLATDLLPTLVEVLVEEEQTWR
ncbi:MAG: NAD(P)H-hydrate dehydratase [Pseudomonadales bacterium]